MYQTFVLGLGLLLVTGLAYYIKSTDTQGVVTGSFSASTTTIVPATAESIPGVYTCSESSGCENPRQLSLFGNGEAKLSASFENGVELIDEFGTWTLNQEGALQVLLTGTNAEVYATPRTILMQTLTDTALSKALFDQSFYADWKNPSFIKEKEL
jgi:hypothetical protein